MPIQAPFKDESKDTFLERCLGNKIMIEEYPDEDQRYAICNSQWEDKEGKSISSEIEKRTFDFLIEKRDDSQRTLIGHAAVFNEYTDMGWFQERVLPGAFIKSIKSDDVRALFNHDANYVLGRMKAGRDNNTLILKEDDKGLAINIVLPDTQVARDLTTLIIRGDISQMSFAFQVLEEAWIKSERNKEPDKRDLIKLKLYDVSPVTYPAYPQTFLAVRSFQKWNESHREPALGWKTGLMRKRLALQIRGGKKYE